MADVAYRIHGLLVCSECVLVIARRAITHSPEITCLDYVHSSVRRVCDWCGIQLHVKTFYNYRDIEGEVIGRRWFGPLNSDN